MNRLLQSAIMSLSMAACSPGLIIRDAATDPHHPTTSGTTQGLTDILDSAPRRVEIVLVHGVGDHCPGYGLDDKAGWFNADLTSRLGLSLKTNVASETIADADNRKESAVDPRSAFYMKRRVFSYKGHRADSIEVEIVELTWSGLTTWVKTNQLGFDLSEPIQGSRESLSCPPFNDVTYDLKREVVNKQIKEDVLDQRLADALLYAGSYGAKLNHAFAELLCRLTSAKRYGSTDICDWAAPAAIQEARFVFITHSLGSRIVYDTLLELHGKRMRPNTIVFSSDYLARAKLRIDGIISGTRAVYMLANQLPLLGLANAPISLRSDDGGVPLIQLSSVIAVDDHQSGETEPADMTCTTNPGACLASIRFALSPERARAEAFDIVAFSDPNDLLSYSIPQWYTATADGISVRFTNAFVQNSFHWFGFFELPTRAHTRYVVNSHVWDLVRCGSVDGALHCKK